MKYSHGYTCMIGGEGKEEGGRGHKHKHWEVFVSV
jgi:hypothetical protein